MCLCQRDAFARKCICLHLGLVRYPGLAQRLQTVRLIHTDHLPHQNRRNGRKRQLGVNIVPTYRPETRPELPICAYQQPRSTPADGS